MKSSFYFPAIIFSLFLLTAAKCNKNTPTPLPEFYFHCQVDGQQHIPDGCTNCSVGKLLGDTTFLINGNRGFEAIGIGVIKLDKIPISVKTYILDQRPEQSGSYDNSTSVSDLYKTDSLRTGELKIISLDKSLKIIEGTFFFKGYNPVQDKVINITEGKFRVNYIEV